MKKNIAFILSFCLVLFLADAAISLLDDTISLALGVHPLAPIRVLASLLVLGTTALLYLAIGVTPAIPKRLILPVVLFNPAAVLLMIPVAIYHYDRVEQFAWLMSFSQLLVGLLVVRAAQGRWSWRWPMIQKTGDRLFSWTNLAGFLAVNAFLVLPGVLFYVAYSASLAVDHFSGGFMALHPGGLSVRAHSYSGADAKRVELIPMIHVGEETFYRQVSASWSSNSVVLLEGVSDNQHLLKNRLSYARMAQSLGLTEQRATFAPGPGRTRVADVDVAEFSKSTLELLNLVTLVHARGITADVVREWLEQAQRPELTAQLWNDLLTRRNEHLMEVFREELPHSDHVVIPWGAAHMPGLAGELSRSGFHVTGSREYRVIDFGKLWKRL